VQYWLLCFLASLAVSRTIANPLAVDDGHRPAVMLSERVEVEVGAGKSLVNGHFRFQQEPPLDRKHTHITIFVPVFLPDSLATRRYEALNGPPCVKIAGRSFPAAEWNDITLEGSPEEVRLPRGWQMRIYVCKVPLRFLQPSFDVAVTYTQLHFPNDIVGYVPIRPPSDKKSCQVTFTAQPGRELRQVSWCSALISGRRTLQFVPRDRKLIRIESLQSNERKCLETPEKIRSLKP
jgi:hypothetical protein